VVEVVEIEWVRGLSGRRKLRSPGGRSWGIVVQLRLLYVRCWGGGVYVRVDVDESLQVSKWMHVEVMLGEGWPAGRGLCYETKRESEGLEGREKQQPNRLGRTGMRARGRFYVSSDLVHEFTNTSAIKLDYHSVAVPQARQSNLGQIERSYRPPQPSLLSP
jgi:hypothetical protein